MNLKKKEKLRTHRVLNYILGIYHWRITPKVLNFRINSLKWDRMLLSSEHIEQTELLKLANVGIQDNNRFRHSVFRDIAWRVESLVPWPIVLSDEFSPLPGYFFLHRDVLCEDYQSVHMYNR